MCWVRVRPSSSETPVNATAAPSEQQNADAISRVL
jgi:hypothetical protein